MQNRDISAGDVEIQLEALAPARPREGLFGPSSETWRVAREVALFAGAWRAALLQLAHPWVAQSIADFSDADTNPVARFHRTFRSVFGFVFGDWEEVRFLARRLHGVHASIRGVERTANESYRANRTEAMRWVAYTLWDTALVVYDDLVEPLTEVRRDAYVREGGRFAGLFGLAPGEVPDTFAGMRRDMERMMGDGTIRVTPEARRLAGALLRPPSFRTAFLWAPAVAGLTASWMPESLRAPLGLPERINRAGRWGRRLARLARRWMPVSLLQVPAYRLALVRMAGGEPSRLLRWQQRLWVGEPLRGAASTSPGP